MNTQVRTIDTRTFRIAVIAVAGAAVLVLAAYLFGTGLRADTSASADRAASLAAQAQRRADFYADLNASAAASKWAAVAAHDVSLARFHIAVNATNAAANASSPAGLYAPGQYQWIRPVGIMAPGAK